MFNLEVDADHCYRVGEQGILVHNASDPATTKARGVLKKTPRRNGKTGFCILEEVVIPSLKENTAWRATVKFKNPSKGVIYILRSKNSNKTILKAGQTGGGSAAGRYADYLRAWNDCQEFDIVAWSIDEVHQRDKLIPPEEAIRAAFCKTCPWDNTLHPGSGPGVPFEHDPKGSWVDCFTWKLGPGGQRGQQQPRDAAEWKVFRDRWKATKKALGMVSDRTVDEAVAIALGVSRRAVYNWRINPKSGL